MRKVLAFVLSVCLIMSVVCIPVLAADTTIYVKPSDFSGNLGTWTVTPAEQGSFLEILKAPGVRNPAAAKSAFVSFEIPADGKFYVFAYSRDFVGGVGADGKPLTSSNRNYKLAVNGTALEKTFGTHAADGWAWEAGGPVDLKAGTATLELIDNVNYYGRCQAIVLTTNASFKGPADKAGLEAGFKNNAIKPVAGVTPVPAVVTTPVATPAPSTAPASGKTADDFAPFNITPTGSGTKDGKLRLIVPLENFPFTVTENSATGLKIKGTFIHKTDKTLKVELTDGTITANEMRAGSTVLVVSCPEGFPIKPHDELDYNKYDMALTISPAPAGGAATPAPSATPAPTPVPTQKPLSPLSDNIPTQTNRPNDPIAVNLNGKYLVFADDSKPFILNNRTLVPFRAIFEALGCTVSWEAEQETAVGTHRDKIIRIPVANALAKVDGQPIYLDQPAVLENSRVFVPLRFVAESLGATVNWIDSAQTVEIIANIIAVDQPENYLFTASGFSNTGTWSLEPANSTAFPDGALKGGVDSTPENAKPAVIEFEAKAGEYNLWVRSRDFPSDRPGIRFFNVAVNGIDSGKKFGTHGQEGFKWADGGKVTLKDGLNKLEIVDTADFYARCDAVMFTIAPGFIPPENYDEVKTLATAVSDIPKGDISITFPAYATEQAAPSAEASIENGDTKVTFYTVPTTKGNVIQNEISKKTASGWVVTKKRSEEFGYIVVEADVAFPAPSVNGKILFNTAFTDLNGKLKAYYGSNIYAAGNVHWFIPTDVTVSGKTATLAFNNDLANFKAVWSLDGDDPKADISVTYKKDGVYTVGAFNGSEIPASQVAGPELVSQDPGAVTKGSAASFSAKGITNGIKTNKDAGIVLRGPNGNFKATVFYPAYGSTDSVKKPGETLNVSFTVISEVQ